MDTQKLILDRLTTVLSETDKSNAAKLKALRKR
jgi:6-phospho-3-hexuloisomerase